tara:strand:- start:2864 stop:3028 length:165 start_codon:yes stop_codon:yes gene_type:complete
MKKEEIIKEIIDWSETQAAKIKNKKRYRYFFKFIFFILKKINYNSYIFLNKIFF